jgi:hypothetical protein
MRLGPARLRRPWLRVLAASLVVVIAVVVALGIGTDFTTQRLTWVSGPSTGKVRAWSRPCWRHARRSSSAYALPCARVEGRVLHTQARDPDGDGDRHLVVLAGAHLVIIKVRRTRITVGTLPGLGARVEAVGLLSRGRLHLPVIDTDTFTRL